MEEREKHSNKFGEFLRSYRKEKNMSLRALSDKTEVSFSHLSKIERGEYQPSKTTVGIIARALDLNKDELFVLAGYVPYQYNSAEGRSGLDALFPGWDKKQPANFLRIPVLGHISAGKPILAQEHIEEYADIPNPGNYNPDELIMLKVKGDSMIGSRIEEGDKVIVKLQPEVENGQIAVVNVNGEEATLKRVKKLENGQILLIPANDKYEPTLITSGDARIIGKVIQVIFEPS